MKSFTSFAAALAALACKAEAHCEFLLGKEMKTKNEDEKTMKLTDNG
jgi:hypothetical protein